jgi:C-terminal processing protease CtpA/Prc
MRIAAEWASRDTVAAMQWAETLPGEGERNAAGQGIRNAAPVGIGAMLTRGTQGLPVVGNIVPGSPASANGALRPGDTLLAVSDASGQWVDTRQLSTRDLLGLVRGEPNTQVSLQVRSAGSSTARVVTLGRQQLIFRPQQ